mmetsp:Transcript_22058/g.63101  ORF Transcript_22058/g.63101 Transcript_22058/m.63101 type:complete len:116 (-) Transcript_22058:213-560(-)
MDGQYGRPFTERIGEIDLRSQREGSQAPVRQMAFARFQWPPRVDRRTCDVIIGLSSGLQGAASIGGVALPSPSRRQGAPGAGLAGLATSSLPPECADPSARIATDGGYSRPLARL